MLSSIRMLNIIHFLNLGFRSHMITATAYLWSLGKCLLAFQLAHILTFSLFDDFFKIWMNSSYIAQTQLYKYSWKILVEQWL
jgi:hypothetical protein